eukprot:12906694-Prorocentrum_lima.AAC.1
MLMTYMVSGRAASTYGLRRVPQTPVPHAETETLRFQGNKLQFVAAYYRENAGNVWGSGKPAGP